MSSSMTLQDEGQSSAPANLTNVTSSKSKPCLDDYTVLEKVGQGAQGSVFRGVHKLSGGIVAIKQIDVSFMGQKERIGVLAEVKVLATLAEDPHPCVMTYQESFVEQGSLWIILEWSANGTLQDALNSVQKKRRAEFEEDEVWNVFLSLALALHHIHDVHVLHRDVKMANVFLHYPEGSTMSPFGALPRVQLGDFGVSTILDDRSRALTMVGTPYYLSPELCMGNPYSTKSDVWSLGVLLYVLLNQKMPYEASNYAALILRIIQDAEAKHHPASSKFSIVLRRMATWCMQKEEKQRPTARDILLHPDCMKRMMRLGLPVPEGLLEAACYRAPSTELASPTGASTLKKKAATPTSATTASSLPDRPLPKRVGPTAPAVVGRRKVRVLQGASNHAQAPPAPLATRGPPTPASVGPVTSSRLFSASQRTTPKTPLTSENPPGTNVLRVMSRGGPAGALAPAPSVVAGKATVPPVRPRPREVAAVRGLPAYGEGASSEEDEEGKTSGRSAINGHSQRNDTSTASPTMRRLHSYEKRILAADPSKANVLLGEGIAGSPLRVGSSRGSVTQDHASYRSHLRSVGDGERPPTRGIVDASAETVALLRKHELVPDGYDDAVLIGSASVVAPAQPEGRLHLSSVPQWSPATATGTTVADGGSSGWAPAQHANITLLGQTAVSSVPEDEELLRSPPGADWSHRALLMSGTAQSSVHEEPHLVNTEGGAYDNDDFEDEDAVVGYVGDDAVHEDDGAGIGSAFPSEERDGEDDDEYDGVDPPPPPGSVVWRIDGIEGASHHSVGPHRRMTSTDAAATAASASVDDDMPTQYFDKTSELQHQVLALCAEGEALVGTIGFAEIIEALTREVPLSSAQLQAVLQSKVSDPAAVPELMYLSFRYIMLAGELQKLRR